MAYVKVTKSSSYFSRFQVKYKRRRQGRTDYRARLRLCTQDKNKYNTPKYRLVVRFSNRDIVCQVANATVAGDVIVAAARAQELKGYGLEFGLTNYAAAYATGLLLARRVLTKFELADAYTGVEEATGEDFNVEEQADGPRPFRCLLDTGLKRTSTGSKVFAALKGALDGGLDIPHSEKRFVGYSSEEKKLDPETLKKYIYGGHVAEYMDELKEESPEKYQQHFSTFIKGEVEGDDLEELYKSVHAKIRESPLPAEKEKQQYTSQPKRKQKKLTFDERKQRLKRKLAELTAGDEEDEE